MICMLMAATFLLLACEENEKPSPVKDTPNPCCEVSCKQGSCKAYGSSCSCTCTFLGKPECHSFGDKAAEIPDSWFDGRTFVILDPNILELVKKDQQKLYSLNKKYATELADALDGYKDLVKKYGLTLKEKKAVVEYYKLVDLENKYEKKFTEEELLMLME